MNQRRTRHAAAVALVAALAAAAGCGLGASDPVTWDLRTPTTPDELEPGRITAVGDEGASSYTVMFPTRTVSGEFREIRATAPIAVSTDREAPAAAIDTVDFVFDEADSPDAVRANVDAVFELFDVEGDDRAALEAFVADVDASVAANDGRIDEGDFVSGAAGSRTKVFGVEGDETMKVVLLVGVVDESFSMTIVVRFDNGTTDDWE